MTTFFVVAGVIWGIGAITGCIVYFTNDGEAEDYARSVFWPLFLAIYLFRGLISALLDAVE